MELEKLIRREVELEFREKEITKKEEAAEKELKKKEEKEKPLTGFDAVNARYKNRGRR